VSIFYHANPQKARKAACWGGARRKKPREHGLLSLVQSLVSEAFPKPRCPEDVRQQGLHAVERPVETVEKPEQSIRNFLKLSFIVPENFSL
jgi:hypothetical protein